MRRFRWWPGAIGAFACVSCAIISADEYSSGNTRESAKVVDAGTAEAASTAADGAAAIVEPIVIAEAVDAHATGAAQQSHLYFASEPGLWVLFAFDAANSTQLVTRTSKDFLTWSTGTTVTLPRPHTGDGRDLAAAALPGTNRTFHLSLSLFGEGRHEHYHARATAQSAGLTFGNVGFLGVATDGQDGLDPDGPAVAAAPDGRIIELSGWTTPDGGSGAGNVVPWTSTLVDDGQAPVWTPTFQPPFQLETVKDVCNAHALAANSLDTLAIWEAGDAEPQPHALRFARLRNGTWSAPRDAGFADGAFDVNDWGLVPIADQVHVLRWSNGYEHRIYHDNAWIAGLGVPSGAHLPGAGTVLLADRGRPRAFVLDADGAVISSTLSDAGWSSWNEVVPKGNPRSGLTGYASEAALALAWVETRGERRVVAGARVR